MDPQCLPAHRAQVPLAATRPPSDCPDDCPIVRVMGVGTSAEAAPSSDVGVSGWLRSLAALGLAVAAARGRDAVCPPSWSSRD
jgi:hypothetical protein